MSVDDFQRLVREHRNRVFNLAFYSLRHREDAEDVTQEVLIRLWHHRRKLEAPAIGAWLTKVTRNACYDLLRRHGARRKRIEEGRDESTFETVATEHPDPHDHAEAADFRQHLQTALRNLPEGYRTVLVLREIEGLKYDEIAEATGRPMSSVKVALHRGRKMLREAMRALGPDAPECPRIEPSSHCSNTAHGPSSRAPEAIESLPDTPRQDVTPHQDVDPKLAPAAATSPEPPRPIRSRPLRSTGLVAAEREVAHA